MKMHLLTQTQINELNSLNTDNSMFICCDHVLGPCVGEHDFDGTNFIHHKNLLDSWNLPLVEITINDF